MTDTIDEVSSLKAHGQSVRSLLYPVGVEESTVTPGVVTVVLKDPGNSRGRPEKYYAAAKLDPILRELVLLNIVEAESAVQGIEGDVAMQSMLSPNERKDAAAHAMARINMLEKLLSEFHANAVYRFRLEHRIEPEIQALRRLILAAKQSYEPEIVKTQEAIDAEAESIVQSLVNEVRSMKVDLPK